MATMTIDVRSAPSTPLNLQTGVTYAPRAETPPFVAYRAIQVSRDEYDVWGYTRDGSGRVLFSGGLFETFCRLSAHLRMDLEA